MKLRKEVQTRDKEFQSFIDTEYQQVQLKAQSSADKVLALESRLAQALKDLDESLARESNQDQSRTFLDELKRRQQELMIKDSEIDSLKRLVKELRETVEQSDQTKELSELKRQHTFTVKEKEMKDVMIGQLKKELEKNLVQIMRMQEKEAQLGAVIQSLTM